MKSFMFGDKKLLIDATPYYEEPTQTALVLHHPDFNPAKHFGVLTVCIPGVRVDEGEFLIKTWSENAPVAAAALASGLFEDTGRRVVAGAVEAEVWRWA